jgi:hypothetical protein
MKEKPLEFDHLFELLHADLVALISFMKRKPMLGLVSPLDVSLKREAYRNMSEMLKEAIGLIEKKESKHVKNN